MLTLRLRVLASGKDLNDVLQNNEPTQRLAHYSVKALFKAIGFCGPKEGGEDRKKQKSSNIIVII